MATTTIEPTTDADSAGPLARAARLERVRGVLPFVVLAVLYLGTIAVSPGYADPAQVAGLLQLGTILGVVAIGQTLVILLGGIDLSVGAVVTLANLATAAVVNGQDGRILHGLLASLAIGLVAGLVNGVVITVLKVPDLVATLATMTVATGVGYLATDGSPRGTSAPGLDDLVTGRFAGVLTWGLLLWAFLAAATIVVLRATATGRRIYAVGLNREASRFAAIRVQAIVVGLYVVSGLTAGLAGFLLTGYTGSSYLGSGNSYQLASIAAVVLGGASIFGGRGGYGGTIAGVLVTILLISVLRVVGISDAGQNIAYGLVIIAMLIVFRRKAATR